MGVLGFKGMLFIGKLIENASNFLFLNCWWKEFRARVVGYYCVIGKKVILVFFIVQLACEDSISLPDVCMITWEDSE